MSPKASRETVSPLYKDYTGQVIETYLYTMYGKKRFAVAKSLKTHCKAKKGDFVTEIVKRGAFFATIRKD